MIPPPVPADAPAPPAEPSARAHTGTCWTYHPECALRAAMDMAIVRRDHAAAAARRYRDALTALQATTARGDDPWAPPPPYPTEALHDAHVLLTATHRAAQHRSRGRGEHRTEGPW